MTPEQTRILVAEDEPDIRDLVTFKLGQAGYTVQAVGSGTLALAAIEENPPDLAVLDSRPARTTTSLSRSARANCSTG